MMGRNFPVGQITRYDVDSGKSIAGARNGNRTRMRRSRSRRILSAACILRTVREPAWILGYWPCVQCAGCVVCVQLGRKFPVSAYVESGWKNQGGNMWVAKSWETLLLAALFFGGIALCIWWFDLRKKKRKDDELGGE